MSSGSTERGLTSSLGKLNIQSAKSKTKKPEPAESWEDEADASSDTETEAISTPIRPSTSDYPEPPPPTPSSPNAAARSQNGSYQPFSFDGASLEAPSSRSSAGGDERRPDKTTSVASRLIAAGIGQKAPRRTKEEREYDQAMRVQEKKKRDQAKAEEEKKEKEKEQAQKDIWGD